jgi:hypothetical protein
MRRRCSSTKGLTMLLYPPMPRLGYAVARTADGTPTSYLVHAADPDYLWVTRGDADALRPMAPAGPVRRSEFTELHLHTQVAHA